MKGKAFALAGAAGAFIVAGAASAAYTGLSIELVDAAAEGWTALGYDAAALETYRVYANFDAPGGVITAVGDANGSFQFGVTQADGSPSVLGFFNSALGSDLPPNPLFTGVQPDLLWDTFVGIGETVAAGPGGIAITQLAPDAATFGAQSGGMMNTFGLDNAGWFVAGFPPQGDAVDGRVLLAQATVFVPQTLGGTGGELVFGSGWRVSGIDSVDGAFDSDQTDASLSSFIVPAPGALALLGIAGLVSGRRRRS